MKTDRAVYTETKITPPPAGESYTDPIFGTTVKRITDCSQIEDVGFGDGRNCWSCQVEYSSISPFNSDSTRLLLMHGSSGFAVYSGDGKFLFYPTVSGRFEVTASAEPRWSAVDPNIFYYLNGNELKRYNVADRTAAVVHRFDEYIVRDSQGVSGVKALGEEDVSWTGDYFGLVGQLPSGARDIFMYNLKTGAKGPVLNRPKQDFDNVYASPEGHLTVAFDDPGVGPNLGQWLYGSDMQPMRQLTGAAGHQDIGLDENGEECLIWADAANPASAGGQVCNPTGIAKVLLKNAAKTPILTLNWDMAAHVYCPRTPGKVLISTYSANPNTAPAPFLDEILIASTDGQRVERLAHHHSTPFTYTHSPRATGNKDLTKVVFNSCMGKADPNYADVYMIDLPASAEPPSGDLSGYSKINFASLEGKELLLKLKVSGGRLTVDMFEKLKT